MPLAPENPGCRATGRVLLPAVPQTSMGALAPDVNYQLGVCVSRQRPRFAYRRVAPVNGWGWGCASSSLADGWLPGNGLKCMQE
jgi:hypothetical protein